MVFSYYFENVPWRMVRINDIEECYEQSLIVPHLPAFPCSHRRSIITGWLNFAA